MLSLVPYDKKFLRDLVPLHPERADLESLHQDLTDFARGYGTQVVVAMENGQPLGVAGWVSLGIAEEGILYGVPVLAGTETVADLLVEHLIGTARELGARQLRISHFPGEDGKLAALRKAGLVPLLEILSMERPTTELPEGFVPKGFQRVPFTEMDWPRFSVFHNAVFKDVPNAPPLNAEMIEQEWQTMDPEASQIWKDESGAYCAWLAAKADGHVDTIGVDGSLRGKGIAQAMYRITIETLSAKDVKRLTVLLASTNHATLRLHAKLGFTEYTRRTVYGLDL